jgi:hypothetical protein
MAQNYWFRTEDAGVALPLLTPTRTNQRRLSFSVSLCLSRACLGKQSFSSESCAPTKDHCVPAPHCQRRIANILDAHASVPSERARAPLWVDIDVLLDVF